MRLKKEKQSTWSYQSLRRGGEDIGKRNENETKTRKGRRSAIIEAGPPRKTEKGPFKNNSREESSRAHVKSLASIGVGELSEKAAMRRRRRNLGRKLQGVKEGRNEE